MKNFLGSLCIYGIILVVVQGIAQAAVRAVNNQSTIDVTATVQPSCTIFANDLLFKITNFNKKIPISVKLPFPYYVQKVLVFLLD